MSGPGLRPTAFAVPSKKVTGYLLDPGHPRGGPKSRFFLGYGFTVERFAELATALLEHAAGAAYVELIETAHGTKFVFEGPLAAPNGKSPGVRSVWQIDTGAGPPARFVTAVPL